MCEQYSPSDINSPGSVVALLLLLLLCACQHPFSRDFSHLIAYMQCVQQAFCMRKCSSAKAKCEMKRNLIQWKFVFKSAFHQKWKIKRQNRIELNGIEFWREFCTSASVYACTPISLCVCINFSWHIVSKFSTRIYSHARTARTHLSYLNINWLPEYVAQHSTQNDTLAHSYWLKLLAVSCFALSVCVCAARSIRLFASHLILLMLKYLNPKQLQNISWRLAFSKWKTNSNVFDCCRTNDNQHDEQNHLHIIDVVCARVRVCVTFLAHVRTQEATIDTMAMITAEHIILSPSHSRMKHCFVSPLWQNKYKTDI